MTAKPGKPLDPNEHQWRVHEQFDVLKAVVEISPGDFRFMLEDHFETEIALKAYFHKERERAERRRLR